ncbi:GNAT family N-acetyltransferase [Gryllotalpicola protaetiae]|uniref:N-acetyltransferase n=1 Tax=Gryllotalpicola protaetiae TaxID=2419771 RepID=A0A387BP35_9MICO|nr:GNAT family N-acetyltransferase [Gryllotalpicola protaetiae]AYG02716.1 N-acetyltransferase [Gryllotalpicola protaetiae]
MSSELIHDTDAHRYRLEVDGKLVSAADYTVNGDRVSFTHTFTDPMQRGHGYAGQVVEFAIDDVEQNSPGAKVVPMCWYVAKWFDEHPERAGLLAD